MTSHGGGGSAGRDRAGSGSGTRALQRMPIKRDDERLGARYIEARYPHAPAGATPDSIRRERQVAFALRDCTAFVIASLRCGAGASAAAPSRRPCTRGLREMRPRTPPTKGWR